MSYDNYNLFVPFYLPLLKNFYVFFSPKTDVNHRVQKILWYNNAWAIHKRGGQNYFDMIYDLSLLHPLHTLRKSNEIYYKSPTLIRFFGV